MKIYNTLTRQKETIEPISREKVNIFVCGPTVYDYSHLGHAKTYTQFDFIVRYLRLRGFDVFYLQNITDLDDKILKRAKELNLPWNELTQRFEKLYFEDMKSLHNTSVSKYARATDYIEQIIKQVDTLLRKGFAYVIDDGIYYEIAKFPDYGKLSGRTELHKDDALSRIDENTQKRGWNDFCLWKFSKPDEPSWNAEFGAGRPGWHIEDTAITETFFGPQYDMHGGAVDLIIPHHEAEIAQMEAVSGKKPLVRFWVHTGFLNINKQKMSKSEGNFTTIREVLEKYNYRVLRFLFLSSHYRATLDFDEETLNQAKDSLNRIDEFIFNSINRDVVVSENSEAIQELKDDIYQDLDDDFNTPEAITKLFNFIRKQNINGKSGSETLDLFKELNTFFDFISLGENTNDEIEELVQKRNAYRKASNFEKADEIRQTLENMGIKLYDNDAKTSWRKV